jgi:hypothetical protein
VQAEEQVVAARVGKSEGQEPLRHRPQSFGRALGALVALQELAVEGAELLRRDLEVDFVLVLEVVVDGLRRHSQALPEPPHGEPLVAALGDDLQGLAEDSLPLGFDLFGPSRRLWHGILPIG